MYLDYFTLAALVDTFRTRPGFLGARLQRVLAVDDWGIGLELYGAHRRHHLYLSADNQEPRIQLMPGQLRRGLAQPQPLAQFLRRRALGARLHAIEQPAWERITHFRLQTTETEFTLIAEPMARRANLLLVQDGIIRECLRRVGPSQNRYRLSLPQHRYLAPPPQDQKRPPWPISETALAEVLSSAGQRPLARALSAHLLAISPLLAREICQRAAISPDTPASAAAVAAVHAALAELVAPLVAGEWQAGVARDSDDGRVLAYSAYPLRQFSDWEACADINEALALYYGPSTGPAAYDAAKTPARAAIDDARQSLARRRASLERGLRDESEVQRLRLCGELILAYQYEITTSQEQLLAVYDAEAAPLAIALEPALSPLENAQAYFQRYQKAKRARDAGPARLAKLARDEALLEQLATDLLLAESWPEIDEVTDALRSAGYLRETRKQQRQPARSGPRRLVCAGYVIWLGRNMRQNAAILSRHSQQSDLWLHARGVPGAHVVIRNDGRKIPESLIEKAARLAAHYSARRGDTSVEVDITERHHVRPIKGGAPGLVRYSGERTLRVVPKDESLFNDCAHS